LAMLLKESILPAMLVVCGEEMVLDSIDSRLRSIARGACVVRFFPHSFDIAVSSKGQALARYSISAREVLVIGNADNDVEMILWAGKGLAMKNSTEKPLVIADAVILGNGKLPTTKVEGLC